MPTGPIPLPESEEFVRSRRRKEAWLRVLDLVAYAVIALSGVFALTVPPMTVEKALSTGIVTVWAVILVLSGAVGFAGRLTRIWVIEAPGAIAGGIAGLVYLAVLVGATLTGAVAGAVGCTFLACMSLLLWRRYVELSLFTTDPGERAFRVRMRDAFRRRTKDSISSGLR